MAGWRKGKRERNTRPRTGRRDRVRVFGRTTGRAEWSSSQKRLARSIGVLALLGALAVGACVLGDLCFVRGDLFRLRYIDIQGGDTLTPGQVRDYFKLKEGMPLFAIDIDGRHGDFLRDAAAARELTIQRVLPDRIEMRIIEREPLARFARTPLVVDAEGCVFPRRAGVELLPTIAGCDGLAIKPGMRVHGMALAAVELLETLRVESVPLEVVEIDVNHEDYIACTMSDQRHAKVAWDEMGECSERSAARLLIQLRGLAKSMNTERGRTSGRWDATVPGRAYAQ